MISRLLKKYSLLLLLVFSVATVTTTTSCAKKVGCYLENNVGPKTNRDGSLSMKRGKSNLFGKQKKRKKIKKRRHKH